jgi:hypothetical protein
MPDAASACWTETPRPPRQARQQHGTRTSGRPSLSDGFSIFNDHGKLRRVPEDWKFPHCPLATAHDLCHSGDEIRGTLPVERLEKLMLIIQNEAGRILMSSSVSWQKLMLKLPLDWARMRAMEVAAHCKSVFFLCKEGALGWDPSRDKKREIGGSKRSLGLRQLI